MQDPDHPNLIAATQAKYNRSTRDHWDHFAHHRRKVFELLVPEDVSAAARGKLCVLGAGNCNDLDLRKLLESFDQIDLVDIDAPALRNAVSRQGIEGRDRLRLHGDVDLTAIASVIAQWPNHPPDNRQIDQALNTLETAPLPDLGGRFDVILSPCLLSQMCLFANDTLGRSHSRRRDLRHAIRRRHVRQLVEWLAPGGTGLLVIDLATTERIGSLVHTHRDRLEEVASRTVAKAQHFPGLDPVSLKAALVEDPYLTGMVSSVQSLSPWLWTLGPHKSFLVYALRFRRSQAAVLGS
jgi:hypothetical protein